MQVPYRNSIILAFLCLGFIAFTTVVKIQRIVPPLATASIQPSSQKPESEIQDYLDATDQSAASAENINKNYNLETIKKNFGLSNIKTKLGFSSDSSPSESGISAKAYLVGNVETGEIYFKYNEKSALPVASMSKLVTAFVATNELQLDKVVEISKEAALAPPDKSMIREGEKFTVEELLQPLLLSSSNIAAEALSSSMDRIEFLELMSGYSWEIGMPSTFFADPSGVSPRNIASAKDIFALAKYLYKSRPDILELTDKTNTDIATTTEHDSHVFDSTHPFSADPRFIGGKTGRTPEAGDTMLTVLNIKEQPVAVVVLGSNYQGREGDTKILIDKVEKIIK